MEQYIPKSALVAEIDRQIELLKPFLGACAGQIVAEANAKLSVLEKLNSFLDTLEVKKVDLEKHLKEDIEDVFFDLNGVAVKGATHYLTVEDVKDIAKHFFELGLKAQKVDIVMDE